LGIGALFSFIIGGQRLPKRWHEALFRNRNRLLDAVQVKLNANIFKKQNVYPQAQEDAVEPVAVKGVRQSLKGQGVLVGTFAFHVLPLFVSKMCTNTNVKQKIFKNKTTKQIDCYFLNAPATISSLVPWP
jgi:hypothetical protein